MRSHSTYLQQYFTLFKTSLCEIQGLDFKQIYMFNLFIVMNLSGSTVTTAWRVLGLRIEDTASRYGG
jgi:hypothetical protein